MERSGLRECRVIELCSSEVPAADRFGWWCDLTARRMLPTVISSDRAADFRASVTMLQLGQIMVAAPQFDGMESTRTTRLIRRSDPELWMLTLVSAGVMQLEQGRNRAQSAIGDLVVHDTSRPFHNEVLHRGGLARTITLYLPRRALPLPEQLLRDQVVRPVSSRRGPGALLGRFMEGLLEQAETLGSAERARLGTVAIDLATVFLAEMIDAARMVPAQTRRQILAREIKAFVQHHLDRADLSPSLIAAAHHISVRYLHRVFQQEERTVGGYIREQRLERCRADMADGRLAGRSVAEIAARWGFSDATTFNRAFRSAYGMPPGEYRKHVSRPGASGFPENTSRR
ncbi:helix-turn-helix domain-containing protein [Streptosporangium fragile]|uniref:Helix-turn-helix domain-containing protein n=1 Tax=Streptosporangium fragile TaxID=46186 RepID=A0ABN3WEL3_9ACTN